MILKWIRNLAKGVHLVAGCMGSAQMTALTLQTDPCQESLVSWQSLGLLGLEKNCRIKS